MYCCNKYSVCIILLLLGIVASGESTNVQKGNPNADIERYFIQLDDNGDGRLTHDEWPMPIRFKLADTLNTGYVTLEEFIAFEVKMRSAEFAADVRFKEMDKHGDGKLTRDEFQPSSQFELADSKNQGVVTFDEFKTYYVKMLQQAANPDTAIIANFNKLDKKGDGKLTPDEWPQSTRFKMADTNGDGVVTIDEYIAFQKKLRTPDFYAEVLFKELDKKGDGKLTLEEWPQTVRFHMADITGTGIVTWEEFLAFQRKLRNPDFSIIVRFKELDKNGDGKLTPDELGNAALFAKIDSGKIGVITFDEFKSYLSKPH